MGQHSIIDKLRGELELPLKRESQALYLMAEVRKYIEHEKSIHETYDVTTRKKLAFHYYPELEFSAIGRFISRLTGRTTLIILRLF